MFGGAKFPLLYKKRGDEGLGLEFVGIIGEAWQIDNGHEGEGEIPAELRWQVFLDWDIQQWGHVRTVNTIFI